MLTRALTAAALLVGTSHAALAGGFAEAVVAPFVAAPVVVETPRYSWTGKRAGIVLGYGEGDGSVGDDDDDDDDDNDNDFDGDGSADLDIDGGIVGLRFGSYKQLSANRVIGSDVTFYTAPDIDGPVDVDGVGTARILVGQVFGADGRTMAYAAGGLALAAFSIGEGDTGIGGGYTVGLGVERAITDRASIFAEVNYTDFGDIGGSDTDADFTGVNVGVNFGF